MGNVYAAEMYTLKRMKSSFVILGLYAIVVIACTRINVYQKASILTAGESNASIFLMLSIVTISTSTFESNTLKNILSSGNSRKDIYRGKLLCAIVISIVYIIISFVGALIGYVIFAAINGGFDFLNFGGKDGNILEVLFKLLLICSTMFLYTFLFFGMSMLCRTTKMSYNIGFFITLILPLAQVMIAGITQIPLFNEINLTVDLATAVANSPAAWTMYLSTGIFIALGVISNILAYVRMQKTEA